MNTFPTGTVTFLFTDIQGSTKLAKEYPEAWEGMRSRHDGILQSAFEKFHGYIFEKTGDAFCVAFSSAGDAVKAAVRFQRELFIAEWGKATVRVRAGIHTGNAELLEGGGYIGYVSLSRVQRLMSAGSGGQTLLSQTTKDLVLDDLPEDISLKDLGEHRLKDLSRPEHIYQVCVPDLPSDFPAIKTLATKLNNLPIQLIPFVGRQQEIAEVIGLLQNPVARLVTLTGPGGTGKTRLSLQVGANLQDEFEHGVWFVELAPITDPNLVAQTIASTLSITSVTSSELALQEYLANRKLLLILDNFEQVVSAASFIGGLLKAAPQVKVLVSSREVLQIQGEHIYPVPPLEVPQISNKQPVAVLGRYDALVLFALHANAVNPEFKMDENNAPIIAEICAQLDGLPLAIELAATRTRLLKPELLLDKFKHRLNILTSGARDLPARQQTMRATINWSFELLDLEEKILFSRLSIFNGGWTIEAAEEICGVGQSTGVLSGLDALLNQSLIYQYDGISGESRFRMLAIIREFALEKLTQSGDWPSMQSALTRSMERLLQHVFEAQHGPEETKWFTKLDDELDNLRYVVEWTLENGQPSVALLAGRLWSYWDRRGNYHDPLGWLDRGLALDYDGELKIRGEAFRAQGAMLAEMGTFQKEYLQRARMSLESALTLYREIDNAHGIAVCLGGLGDIAWKEKEFHQASQLFEQSLQIFPEPISWANAITLMNLGGLAMINGNYQEAFSYYTQARNMSAELDSETGIAFADWALGKWALAQRKLDETEAYIQSTINSGFMNTTPFAKRFMEGYIGYVQLLRNNQEVARRLLVAAIESFQEYYEKTSIIPGEPGDGWFIFDGKARLELQDGRLERAAQLFGAAWNQRELGNNPISEAESTDYEACILEIRAAIGDARFEVLFKQGQMMKIKDALFLAMG